MKARKAVATATAVVVGGLLSVAGTAQAAPDPKKYPKSQGWTYVNDRIVIKAGEASNKRVILRYWGHDRILLLNDQKATPVLDPQAQPQGGDHWMGQSADSQMSVRAPSTGKVVRRMADGELIGWVSEDVKDVRFAGVGKNLFWGVGVRGIQWFDGIQNFLVTDWMNEYGGTLSGMEFTGTKQQMCGRLGLRPVMGTVPGAAERMMR